MSASPRPRIWSRRRGCAAGNTTDSWTARATAAVGTTRQLERRVPTAARRFTIATTTANVLDNLSTPKCQPDAEPPGDSLTINNGIALDVFGPSISNAGTITVGSAALAPI